MKRTACILIVLLAIAVILVPASAAESVSAGYSSGAGTPDDPQREATAYIADAQAAVAIRDWPSVLTATTRGLAYYPDNADLLCLQGYTLRKLGQYDRAVDVVSTAVMLDPKPVRYANRGYAYLALGNNSAALADAEAAVALDENYSTAWGVRALALHGMGRDTEALAAVEQAIALDPESAHYHHIKGIIHGTSRDCAGARDALQRSIDLDPEYVLPWPGFSSPREELEALNAICAPSAPPSSPATTQAGIPAWILVVGIAGAVVMAGMKR